MVKKRRDKSRHVATEINSRTTESSGITATTENFANMSINEPVTYEDAKAFLSYVEGQQTQNSNQTNMDTGKQAMYEALKKFTQQLIPPNGSNFADMGSNSNPESSETRSWSQADAEDLLHAAEHLDHAQMRRLLFDCKVPPALPANEYGWKPIHLCAFNGDPVGVKMLLDAGQDVDGLNSMQFRETALILASTWGHIEVVELLLENKANVFLMDCHGRTALDCARNGCNFAHLPHRNFPQVMNRLSLAMSDIGEPPAPTPKPKGDQPCHHCHGSGDGEGLKACSACRVVAYCSKDCQRKHWPTHKTLCKQLRTMQVALQTVVDGSRPPDSRLEAVTVLSCHRDLEEHVGAITELVGALGKDPVVRSRDSYDCVVLKAICELIRSDEVEKQRYNFQRSGADDPHTTCKFLKAGGLNAVLTKIRDDRLPPMVTLTACRTLSSLFVPDLITRRLSQIQTFKTGTVPGDVSSDSTSINRALFEISHLRDVTSTIVDIIRHQYDVILRYRMSGGDMEADHLKQCASKTTQQLCGILGSLWARTHQHRDVQHSTSKRQPTKENEDNREGDFGDSNTETSSSTNGSAKGAELMRQEMGAALCSDSEVLKLIVALATGDDRGDFSSENEDFGPMQGPLELVATLLEDSSVRLRLVQNHPTVCTVLGSFAVDGITIHGEDGWAASLLMLRGLCEDDGLRSCAVEPALQELPMTSKRGASKMAIFDHIIWGLEERPKSTRCNFIRTNNWANGKLIVNAFLKVNDMQPVMKKRKQEIKKFSD